MKYSKVLILVLLTFSLFILGCVEVPVSPFTVGQFVSKSTDLNYTLFAQGVYDGNCLKMDFNKISVGSCLTVDANIDWNKLIDFPAGCGANQAVKIVGTSLVCVDLPIDTNTQSVGWTDVSGKWLIDLNTAKNLRADGNFLCDKTTCYKISDLNFVPDLSGFVPYIGATSDVNLGNNNLEIDDNLTVYGRIGIDTNLPTYSLDVHGNGTFEGINTDMGLNLDYILEPPLPTLALASGGSNLCVGAYWYGVTYIDNVGETREANFRQITTDSSNRKVTITVPTSTDYRVTGRKIYRSTCNGPQYSGGLLIQLNDNSTTTYLDDKNDASLIGGFAYFRDNTTNKGIMVNGTNVFQTGVNITKMGLFAGNGITTGGRSTFLGYSAGSRVSTGADNTFVGYNTGAYVAGSSGGNTIVGTYALSNTDGSGNTVMGYGGMLSTAGSSNVILGNLAGYTAATASNVTNNTCLGSSSCYNFATNAIGNTVVGWQASHYTLGNYNVLLGNQAGYSQQGSYKLFIDIGDTNRPLIWGDFSLDDLNFNGDVNVTGKFDVNQQARFRNDLNVDGNFEAKIPHGTFVSLKTQTVAAPNTAYVMDFNTTMENYGLTRIGDTNFKVPRTGSYEAIISVLAESNLPGKMVNVWFQKNGVNVPNSNTPYNFKETNSITVISIPFTFDMNTTDVLTVNYSADDTGVTLPFSPASGVVPASPSSVITIKWISSSHP